MENTNSKTQQTSNNQEMTISIRDIVYMVLGNWYWFVVSVVACLIVVGLVYKSKPKTYSASSTILLRDDSNTMNFGGRNMDAMIANMGMETGGVLENEIYVIGSSRLMHTVSERLHLNNTCTMDKMFKKVSFYKDRPIMLKMFSADGADTSFTIEVTPLASGLKYAYKYDGNKGEAQFGQRIALTANHAFAVLKTENFNKSYEGATFILHQGLMGTGGSRVSVDRKSVV